MVTRMAGGVSGHTLRVIDPHWARMPPCAR